MAGSVNLTGSHLKRAEKMLKKVAQLLNKLKIEYILDGGTLLGIIREDRLLPWDSDVDLSIRGEDAEMLIKNRWKLWLRGYRTRIRYFETDIPPFKKGMPRIIKVQTHILGVKQYDVVDIFVKYKIEDEYLNLVGKTTKIIRNFPPNFLEELTTIKFKDFEYLAPQDFKGYLTRIYGDWKTPVKEWDYKRDNKCVKAIID